jgi:hypothetical protein
VPRSCRLTCSPRPLSLACWISAEAAALPGGGSVLRVDVIVTYLPIRPAGETIPRAAVLTITPVYPMPRSGSNETGSAVTVTDPAEIAKITELVNALPIMSLESRPCPISMGVNLRLVFRATGGSTLAEVDASPDGCGSVDVTVGGTVEPTLSGGPELIDQISAVLGTHWQLASP